ncbi:MAG: hypothetical protein OXQ96_07610, partial [Alphaproteobacteria bacterium]|nr:hypothetical protein [Alphaproteobacteria bacterium]
MTEDQVHPMDRKPALAVRVALLEERNRRVERDKAWETSWFRLILLMMVIYAFAAIFLMLIGVANAFVAACVPSIGFFISTLSLPIIKKIWVSSC